MKISLSQDKQSQVRNVRHGDVFSNGVEYYIRTNAAIHTKDQDACYAVRLTDGVLTSFGPNSLVTLVNGEFKVT
jgi:hypothetical protein